MFKGASSQGLRGILTERSIHRSICASLVLAAWILGVHVPATRATQMWNASTGLPSGANTANSEVVTSPTGATLLYYLSAVSGFPPSGKPTIAAFEPTGQLGAPTQAPPDPTFGGNATAVGPIAFLPNGDAVVSWAPDEGQFSLVYRFANGTFGPVLKASNMTSFAARPGEVLASVGGAVTDYAIAANGAMTKTGSATIYTGETLFGETWTALDADGRADVMINGDQKGILDVSRTPDGSWGAPREMAPFTNNAKAAVAPDGRAIAEWQESSETTSKGGQAQVTQWAAIREPGGTFGAPQQINELKGPGGVQDKVLLAAGGDGTLALADESYICPSPHEEEHDAIVSTTAYVASPGNGLTAYGVPGSTWSASSSVGLDSLGAGDGAAIVGMHSISSSDYPQGTAGCFGPPTSPGGPYHYTGSDYAALLGPSGTSTQAFGAQGPVEHLGRLMIDAAGLDLAGNAVAMGSLTTPGGAEYETYGTPGSAKATTPGGGTGSGGSNGSGSGGGSSGSSGGGSTSSGAKPPINIAPAAGLINGSPNVSGSGQQSLTLSNPNDYSETAVIQEVAQLTGGAVIAKHKSKMRTLTVSSAHVTIGSHKQVTIKLKLSSAARKLLRRYHKLPVTLKITLTAPGRPATVVTRRLVLRLR